MTKWELLRVGRVYGKYFDVAPHVRINLDGLSPKPKEVKYIGYKNSDELLFENDNDSVKAKHALLDILGDEGWEPYATEDGDIYLKRPKEETNTKN